MCVHFTCFACTKHAEHAHSTHVLHSHTQERTLYARRWTKFLHCCGRAGACRCVFVCGVVLCERFIFHMILTYNRRQRRRRSTHAPDAHMHSQATALVLLPLALGQWHTADQQLRHRCTRPRVLGVLCCSALAVAGQSTTRPQSSSALVHLIPLPFIPPRTRSLRLLGGLAGHDDAHARAVVRHYPPGRRGCGHVSAQLVMLSSFKYVALD